MPIAGRTDGCGRREHLSLLVSAPGLQRQRRVDDWTGRIACRALKWRANRDYVCGAATDEYGTGVRRTLSPRGIRHPAAAAADVSGAVRDVTRVSCLTFGAKRTTLIIATRKS